MEKREIMSGLSFKEMENTHGRHSFTAWELALMALLAASGVTCKPLISPVFNFVTDFIRIPGGSCTAGFSLMFLVLGKRWVPARGTATMMAAVQVLLAIFCGVWSAVGVYMLASYLVPGIVIDLVMGSGIGCRFSHRAVFQAACALGVVAGAAVNNLLFFRLFLVPALLFYLLGAVSGMFCGWLAALLYERLPVMSGPNGQTEFHKYKGV